MFPLDLLPTHSGLTVTAVTATADLIAVAVTPSAATARCPACGTCRIASTPATGGRSPTWRPDRGRWP